ncbi:BACON domain-containing protein [uncultured Bacteroides sp.]|uniref:BACON domain-containing protein n=1 Tax=uncultured Bacteroides sp. TaxID=162156 RepID=UPI0025E595F7|nr:BACON domain-containing protein [uncultured Bacteroides sp.]
MKYLHKVIAGLVLCTGCITSCKDDNKTELPGGFLTDKEEIAIGPEGGLEKITVLSDISWVAGASKPWIAVSPANGLGAAECQLAIDSTLENTARMAQIRFSSEQAGQKLITVTQFGFGKQILLNETDVEIENSARYEKRTFEMVVSTNINFKIGSVEYAFDGIQSDEEKAEYESERTGWLTQPRQDDLAVDLDRKARPRTVKANFRWEMNTAPFVRVAKIHLVPIDPANDQLVDDNGNPIEDVVLTVKQKPALKIEDNRAGDSLAVITINEKVQSMIKFETSENMQNWENVTLWEATDKDLPCEEAVGRIRSVNFVMIDMKEGESLPKEVRYLKYLESFSIRSNANSQIRDIHLGEEICELKHLKELVLYSYGITSLPANFAKLGGATNEGYAGLKALSLSATNFATLSTITKVVNKENFPYLTSLALNGSRRTDSLSDLTLVQGGKYNGRPIGLFVNVSRGSERDALLSLLLWENLQSLTLAYNFIEGELPTDEEMETALERAGRPTHYTSDDFSTEKADYLDKLVGDTCRWLLTDDNPVTFTATDETTETVTGQEIPRVLPKTRYLSINLNFLTGKLPNWVLFHPYFAAWYPEIGFFIQQERGKDSAGKSVGFGNIDADNFDFTYYYGAEDPGSNIAVPGVAYPLYYRRFVANSATEDAE